MSAAARARLDRAAPVDETGPEPGRGVERALRKRRAKYEDEHAPLLAAARAVMASKGRVDPTVTEILAEAGLSTTAFYRHFPTKDDLLLTLVEHAGVATRAHLAAQLAKHEAPSERITAWIRGMFDLLRTPRLVTVNRPFLLAHPRLVERFPKEIAAMVDLLVAPLAQAIADARAEDGQSPGDAATDARLVHHQVFGILVDHAAERRSVPTEMADAVVAYARRAVLGRLTDQR